MSDIEPWRDPNKWVTQVESLEAEITRLRAELTATKEALEAKNHYKHNLLVEAEKNNDELLADNERLRAELATRQWQPLSTAPRDGTVIDVYIECAQPPGRRARKDNVRFLARRGLWVHDDEIDDMADCPVQGWPTHWKPKDLSVPPADGAKP